MRNALTRQLLALACAGIASCAPHGENKIEARSSDCGSCHADEQRLVKSPSHEEAGFGEDCGSCHDQATWQSAPGYTHTSAFPLTLAHAEPTCSACHAQGYAPGAVANECVQCHSANASAVADPVHAGLSTNCFACHRTDAFLPALFIHSWPLKGVHENTACGACHTGNPARYEGTSTFCISCHTDDFDRANRAVPDHETFGTTCETCHGFESFAM